MTWIELCILSRIQLLRQHPSPRPPKRFSSDKSPGRELFVNPLDTFNESLVGVGRYRAKSKVRSSDSGPKPYVLSAKLCLFHRKISKLTKSDTNCVAIKMWIFHRLNSENDNDCLLDRPFAFEQARRVTDWKRAKREA